MRLLRRLYCELFDHDRVTEHFSEPSGFGPRWFTVTRCIRCGYRRAR